MSGWRAIKRKALGTVHETFRLPCVYLTHQAGNPAVVLARLHRALFDSNMADGDFANAATLRDTRDYVICARANLVPVMNAYFIFDDSEVFRTGPNSPDREGYIRTEIALATSAERDKVLGWAAVVGDSLRVEISAHLGSDYDASAWTFLP